jgi:RNA-binding protein YhbY
MVTYIKKIQIGKSGLTLEVMNQIKFFFERERMIKVVLLKSACRDKKDAEEIAKQITDELGPKYKAKLVGYVLTVAKFRKA